MRSRWTGAGAALVAVAASTALIYPLKHIAPVVSLSVVYLLGVLFVSAGWGVVLGVATALASAAAFNYFHLPPTGNFTIAQSEDAVALVVYVIVAVAGSTLAELARSREREAELRREEADRHADTARALLAERDRLMAEAVEAQALRRSDEVKTALLRAVSHDLRTPLTSIITSAEALQAGTVGPGERAELSATVSSEARRLSDMIDKLLDLSRLQGGHAEPHRDWVALDEVIASAVDALAAGAEVQVAIEPALPLVHVDAAQVERALANVLDNAARHSAGRPIRVKAHRRGNEVCVRIVDDGPGIRPGELDRVFEPFWRGDGDAHKGSGLGLAIARGFVEANGGRLAAEPNVGRGAVFVMRLPCEAVPAGVR